MSTVAGTGQAGFNGDATATTARLFYPAGLAVDGVGNLYIADEYNHRVRKLTAATGVLTTIAGTGTAGSLGDNGPATTAQLNFPLGVAVDSSNNVYIADNSNHNIRKVTTGDRNHHHRRRDWDGRRRRRRWAGYGCAAERTERRGR